MNVVMTAKQRVLYKILFRFKDEAIKFLKGQMCTTMGLQIIRTCVHFSSVVFPIN